MWVCKLMKFAMGCDSLPRRPPRTKPRRMPSSCASGRERQNGVRASKGRGGVRASKGWHLSRRRISLPAPSSISRLKRGGVRTTVPTTRRGRRMGGCASLIKLSTPSATHECLQYRMQVRGKRPRLRLNPCREF